MSLNPKYTLNTGGHAPTYRERKPQAWTSAYHSNYLQAFATVLRQDILKDKLLTVGGLVGGYKDFPFTFTFKTPADTIITTVTAWVSIIPLDGNSYLRTWLNNVEFGGAAKLGIPAQPGLVQGQEYMIDDSVIGFILPRPPNTGEAMNRLTVRTWNYKIFAETTCKVSIWLEIEYTGSEPSVEPPPFWEDWPTWWPYAAGGLGMAAVGGILLMKKKR